MRQLQPITSVLLVAVLLMRFSAIWIMGPMPQDAYYFLYAQHPAFCYFDHPPAIAFLLKFFTDILGKEVYVMKAADSILTAGTCYMVFRLSKRFLPETESIKTVIIFSSTLMVTILSLVSSPDTPLLFFWTVSLIALYDAIFNEKKYCWLFSGLLMGLAFQSKYTAIFLPFGMLLFLTLSANKRKFLRTGWPWATCLVMIIVSFPVIVWNIKNGFASFAFQGIQRLHAAAELNFNLKFVAGFVGHQLALLIPIALIAIIYSIWKLLKIYHHQWSRFPLKIGFLLCFFLPLFLIFVILSPIYWIKINWMMPAYISALILAIREINTKWLKMQLAISCLVHLALILEILYYPFPIKSDDTWLGWEDLAAQVSSVARKYHTDFIFSADSYKTSAELNLYNNNFVYGQNVIGEQALQFDFMGTDLSLLTGKSAVFIDSDPNFKDTEKQLEPPARLSVFFASVQQIAPIMIKFHGRPVRKFYVYICRGYKPASEKTIIIEHQFCVMLLGKIK